MNLTQFFAAGLPLLLLLTACSTAPTDFRPTQPPPNEHEIVADAVEIALADNEIKVDGVPAGTHTESPVYIGNDILYYESGKDFTYGEGSEADAHSPEEAAELAKSADKAMVIGGGTVYRQMLPLCDRAYITKVHVTPESDTYFPNLDEAEDWELSEILQSGEEDGISYEMCLYKRKGTA